MDTKRFLTGTIVGGVVLYAVGYVIFNMIFASFYAANGGSASGIDRSPQIQWAVLLGSFGYAALICYAMGARGALGLSGGAKVGAIVGLLIWLTADFIIYGATNMANLTQTIVDPLLELLHGGIGGAVIGLLAQKMKPAS